MQMKKLDPESFSRDMPITFFRDNSIFKMAFGSTEDPLKEIAPSAANNGSGRSGPDDSMKATAVAGWAILLLFFGGFGVWANTAPLNGAVMSNGVVKVDGNRKSIQHLDGGIIKQLNVKEGDHVTAGDSLLVLDESQAHAEYDVYFQQFLVLRATEERLKAELVRASGLQIPADLKSRLSEPNVLNIWNGQIHQFESRQQALEGQRNVIREKINQLQAQIVGGEAQVKSFR